MELSQGLTPPRRTTPCLLVWVLAGTLAACASPNPLAPPAVLVGQYGGVDVELFLSNAHVSLVLPCGGINFAAPIEPLVDGTFTVSVLGRAINRPLPPAILSGKVSGSTLTINVRYLVPDSTPTFSYTASKSAAAQFRSACALSVAAPAVL